VRRNIQTIWFLDRIEFLLVVVSLDLKSSVHKIFFAMWFEFEDMDWCLTVVWKMSSNSD